MSVGRDVRLGKVVVMQVRRWLAVVVASAVIAATAVGCAEEDADSSGGPSPTQVSTSPSATDTQPVEPTEPTPPAAMERNDAEGAKAFAEYYWQVVNYAQATGDTALLKRLELPGCAECRGGRVAIEETYDSGGKILRSEYAADATKVRALARSGTERIIGFDVLITLSYSAGQRTNEAGDVTRRQKAGRTSMTISVYLDPVEKWGVAGWERRS